MAKRKSDPTTPAAPAALDDEPERDCGPFDIPAEWLAGRTPAEWAVDQRAAAAEAQRQRAVIDSHVDRAQAKAIAAELDKVNRAQAKVIAAELVKAIAVDRAASGKLIVAELAKVTALTNPTLSSSTTKTETWIAADIDRLKVEDKLRKSMRITRLAQLLEDRMREAAKSDKFLRVVEWRHIKNYLPRWGLWPLKLDK